MDIRLKIDTSGHLLAGKAPAVVQKHIDRFVTQASLFLLAEVKKRTPQGVFGAQGGLLGSIQQETRGKGTPLVKGIVATAQKYGEVIEKGRRPGKGIPPQGSLVFWIAKKFGIGAMAAAKLEYVIRRKIGQKGFEGAHMFEKALQENLGRIKAMAEAEGIEIAEELNG